MLRWEPSNMLTWLRSLGVRTSRTPPHPVLDHELTATVAAVGLWGALYFNTWKHMARSGKLPTFRWIDEIGDWWVGIAFVILWWIAARFRLGAFIVLGISYWFTLGVGRYVTLHSPERGLAYQFVENQMLWLGVAAVGGALLVSFLPIVKLKAAEIALFLGAASTIVFETIPNLVGQVEDIKDIPAGILGGLSAYLVLRTERVAITEPFDHFLRATGLLFGSFIIANFARVPFLGLLGLSIVSAVIVLYCAAFAGLPRHRFMIMVLPQVMAILCVFISCLWIDEWKVKLLSFLGLAIVAFVRSQLPIPLTRSAEPASATSYSTE